MSVGTEVGDEVRRCRAWTLFVFLPGMLLHKLARGETGSEEQDDREIRFVQPRQVG